MRSFLSMRDSARIARVKNAGVHTEEPSGLPTNGSFKILNPSAENFSSSLALRVPFFTLRSQPSPGGISVGAGMNSTPHRAWLAHPCSESRAAHRQANFILEGARAQAALNFLDGEFPTVKYLLI